MGWLQILRLQSTARTIACVACGAFVAVICWFLGPYDMRFAALVIGPVLIWAAFIDIERFILPNVLTYPIIASGLVWAAIFKTDSFVHYLVGAVAGYGALSLVSWAHMKRTGKLGLGLGDAKLFAGAGAWLGWAALPSIMILAAVGGLIAIGALSIVTGKVRRDMEIAFGPYIVVGFLGVWLFGSITQSPY